MSNHPPHFAVVIGALRLNSPEVKTHRKYDSLNAGNVHMCVPTLLPPSQYLQTSDTNSEMTNKKNYLHPSHALELRG